MQLYNEATDDYDKEIELTPWMVNWIIEGGKVREGYDPFGRLAERTAKTNEAIARADMLLDELHDMLNVDPFGPGDCLPDVEPEYNPALEWDMMTSQLRRGEG